MSKEQIFLCVPLESRDAGNRVAAVLDSDTGGHRTFQPNYAETTEGPATHCWAGIMVLPELAALIRTKDPSLYHTHLGALAQQRNRPEVSLEDCTSVAESILIDGEITQVPVE